MLIVKLLEFFKFYTTHETINYDFMRTFYKGVLRVLLMFLHDYNDFLSEYAYVFIEVIPSHLIQIRNIILSAYPKDIYQREPFTITNVIVFLYLSFSLFFLIFFYFCVDKINSETEGLLSDGIKLVLLTAFLYDIFIFDNLQPKIYDLVLNPSPTRLIKLRISRRCLVSSTQI